MPASFDNSGKPAYMYDSVGNTWYAFGGKIDTASAYEWTNTQTYLNTTTFNDTVNMLDGFNNFLNPAARNAAITSPVHGTICFVRQDAGGNPLNQIQYYNGSAWVANDGDISGVTAGTGLSGGGTAGTITLSVDTAVVATTNNTLTLTNKTINGSNNTITNIAITSAVSGLGTNVATFLATPSSANLASAITDETGSGSLVFGTSPTLATPVLNQPKLYLGYSAKTDNYTIANGDQGYLFSMNAATAKTFSIPTDATFNFDIGTHVSFVWITGAGQPTIAASSPGTTTILSNAATTSSPKLRMVNSAATAVKLSANTWLVLGDLT